MCVCGCYQYEFGKTNSVLGVRAKYREGWTLVHVSCQLLFLFNNICLEDLVVYRVHRIFPECLKTLVAEQL